VSKRNGQGMCNCRNISDGTRVGIHRGAGDRQGQLIPVAIENDPTRCTQDIYSGALINARCKVAIPLNRLQQHNSPKQRRESNYEKNHRETNTTFDSMMSFCGRNFA
jgi:hypothetical protein